MKKIFLGGTCNNSKWRESLKTKLNIEYFDPQVPNWTPEAQKQEIVERNISDYVLYTITPLMTGVYSIAEVVDDSNKRPEKTLLCIMENDTGPDGKTVSFPPHTLKSLYATAKMVKQNGGSVYSSLEDVATRVNEKNQ
jgi:hypothetical protein